GSAVPGADGGGGLAHVGLSVADTGGQGDGGLRFGGDDDTGGAEVGGGDDGGEVLAEEQDELVQQWFCDEQLPSIEEAVREKGVRLERTSAMAPGMMAAGVVPNGSWPPPAAAVPRRGTRKPGRKGSANAAQAWQQQQRQRER
ncbi:hypothetical protein ACWC5I_42675, partial [Kitasatospora sp. NPDC001574]